MLISRGCFAEKPIRLYFTREVSLWRPTWHVAVGVYLNSLIETTTTGRGSERQQWFGVPVNKIIFRSLQLVSYVKCARTVKEFKLERTRENWKFVVHSSRCRQKLKFHHFMSLSWWGPQKKCTKMTNTRAVRAELLLLRFRPRRRYRQLDTRGPYRVEIVWSTSN